MTSSIIELFGFTYFPSSFCGLGDLIFSFSLNVEDEASSSEDLTRDVSLDSIPVLEKILIRTDLEVEPEV